jgi:hypothetical protein
MGGNVLELINNNNKMLKITILFLATVFICSFAVNTADAADVNDNKIYVNVHTGNNSWDGLSPAYNKKTGSGPKATIANATGTVKSGGYVYIAQGVYKEQNITLKKSMNIAGDKWQDTTISAKEGNIFNIRSGVTITIKNLGFANGTASKGGAINNNGTLKVYDCYFTNNQAPFGGAINNDGQLILEKSIFSKNTASGGGAVANNGKANIKYCVFDDNYSPNGVGGAITNYDALTLNDSVFNHNSAWFFGGAIYNHATLNISNTLFTENNVTNEGGAIFNYVTGNLILNNASFDSNKAVYENGGAIVNLGTLAVNDSDFTKNTAPKNGGAIDNQGALNVKKSSFNRNAAGNCGGAINNSGNGKLKVSESKFTGNTADIGGAIENSGPNGTLTVTGSSFTSNSAINGGAIDNDGSLDLINSSFTKNKATLGGAIENGLYGTGLVVNCKFNTNQAENGGAIYNYGHDLTVVTSEFTSNSATNCGVIANYLGSLTVTGSTFKLNNAKYGAGIYNNQGNLNANSNYLTGNKATYGGAVYNDNGNTYLHFNRIVGNSAKQGKAIYNNGGSSNAILNWWGYNAKSRIAALLKNNGKGSITYDPWIVLTINSSPSKITVGGKSNITADLLHDNNGVYYGTQTFVPYSGYTNFKTNKGSIKNAKFVVGKAQSTLTNLTTAQLVNVSALVDYQAVSTEVNVTGLTIKQLITAARDVKMYYEKYGYLPTKIYVSKQAISMPQFLQLLTTGTVNIKNSKLTPLSMPNVQSSYNSTGNYKKGNIKLSEYLKTASEIQKYIKTHRTAPKNVKTSLGTVSFNKLVYNYSKILNFYRTRGRLPNYVIIDSTKDKIVQSKSNNLVSSGGATVYYVNSTVGYDFSLGQTIGTLLSRTPVYDQKYLDMYNYDIFGAFFRCRAHGDTVIYWKDFFTGEITVYVHIGK